MLNVLIAEDELFVRLGIKNSIKWGDYDMQVVCNVENGKIAWEKIEQYKPDIILTDIRMPEMDGLQLVEKINAMHEDIYVIVITCLEDFDMVKKLLSLGIKDYLLKSTMTEDELNTVLQKAQNYFTNVQSKNTNEVTQYIDHRTQCNVAISNFLYYKSTMTDVQYILERNEISLNNKQLVVAFGKIDVAFDFEQNPIKVPVSQIHDTIFDLIHSKTYSEFKPYIFSLEDNHFVIILAYPPNFLENDVKNISLKTLKTIHSDIEDYVNILVSFSIGYSGRNLESLRESFDRCKQEIADPYITGDGTVICDWSDEITLKITEQCNMLLKAAYWIKDAVSDSALNEYERLVHDLTQSIVSSKGEMTYSLMEIATFIAKLSLNPIDDEKKKCDKTLIKSHSLSVSVSAIVSFLQSCEQKYLLDDMPTSRKEIKLAVEFINQNLDMTDLSLGLVAKQIGLSETYFSMIFKQEMKQPFIQFLTYKRIEKAKKLLKETTLKMVDISVQVGFSDVAYFSKVFKKSVNISPSEWRELW